MIKRSDEETSSEDLPETVEEILRTITEQHLFFTGPLPPPALFDQYEKILPGAADRIMGLAENEQRIREKEINSSTSSIRWQIVGAVLVNVILVLGLIFGGIVYAVKTGDSKTGAVLGGLSILPLVIRGLEILTRKKPDE